MLGIIFYLKISITGLTKTEEIWEFPSPYWGLFFYPILGKMTQQCRQMSSGFRPRIGDYFFIIERHKTKDINTTSNFRPRTGDYFLSLRGKPIDISIERNSFRPYTGDYVFIMMKNAT